MDRSSLRSLQRPPSPPLPSISSLAPCRRGEVHAPKSKVRRGRPEYSLFQAASDGCLRCVRRKLEVESPDLARVVSDSSAWTVHDFANHGVDQGQAGAAEVVAYLASSWLALPRPCLACPAWLALP